MSDTAFDDLMGDLNHNMVVVTTAKDGVRAGCLVGFHGQCGMSPAMYAVWLSKANHTYRIAALSDVFAIHFLSAAQKDLAELFGTTTGNDIDKFERCAWSSGPDGVPVLDGCTDRFVGRRRAWLDPGSDHVCLVVEPVDATHAGGTTWLMLQDVLDLDAGHPAEDRQRPIA
jgi:flavin reductase (DIM6/NTAB) family NADH-FMN oxidoreductase RutF